MTDYTIAFWKISLNATLSQETTPQASFTATGDDGGTLYSVYVTMKYSTIGGANCNV